MAVFIPLPPATVMTTTLATQTAKPRTATGRQWTRGLCDSWASC